MVCVLTAVLVDPIKNGTMSAKESDTARSDFSKTSVVNLRVRSFMYFL